MMTSASSTFNIRGSWSYSLLQKHDNGVTQRAQRSDPNAGDGKAGGSTAELLF